MARVLILGGGFGGVVAAESLVKQVGDRHQITLVSRNSRFLFYPALVRLAFETVSPTTFRSTYDGRCWTGGSLSLKVKSRGLIPIIVK